MPPLSISEAKILELWLGAIFVGLFLVTFFLCMRALLFDDDSLKKKEHIHWPMLAVALLIFFFVISGSILLLVRNIKAFVFYTGPGGSEVEFKEVSSILNILGVGNVIELQ
jgi:hypothetical protein